MNAILDHKKGDTWDGIEMYFEDSELVNNQEVFTPKNLTGYSFKAQFRASKASTPAFEFKTSDQTIKFKDNNPLLGIIEWQPRDMNYPARQYIFDVKMTSPDGQVDTLEIVDANPVWNIL